MDKFLNNIAGGLPFVLDDFRFDDSAVRDAIKGILSGFLTTGVDNFIVYGCEVTTNIIGGNTEYTVSEGYIFYEGEIFYVAAHVLTEATSFIPYWGTKIYYDPTGNKTFQDLNSHDTYQKREMELLAAAAPPSGYMPLAAAKLEDQIKLLAGLDVDTWHTVGDTGEPVYNDNWAGVTGEGKRELRFKKTPTNQVHIEGACLNSSPTTNPTKIFTLPTGYRPANLNSPGSDTIRTLIIGDNTVLGKLAKFCYVNNSGELVIEDVDFGAGTQYIFNIIIPLD